MASHVDQFLKDAESRAHDPEHKRKLLFNIGQYDKKVVVGKQQYSNLPLARKKASAIKSKVTENMEKYLIEFETNFKKNGGKVIWAPDAEVAMKEIIDILKRINAKMLVKSKSMVTEEVDVNHICEKYNIESLETDLGEVIQQMDGEAPYHIVTPAMHKSKEDVAKLFNEKKGTPIDWTPEQITAYVRKMLREKYPVADAGITGGNFLIADIGGVEVSENEGNAFMSVAFPKVHIAIVGIEKILPTLADLDLFLPLLATHGTGQRVTVYNNILTGPRQSGEEDGPEEMYVVLLDNGRTDLLARKEQRRALNCIRCGACLNACPIYRNIGGHAYGTTYSGPIGSVITPSMKGMKDFKHLSYASSLCGRCTEVCPVEIDIHHLLLLNRKDSVEEGFTNRSERTIWNFWRKAMLKRSRMERGGASFKNFMIRRFFKDAWGTRRDLPVVAPKSFNQLWKERMKGKS
ncbi:MAG TPA: lactate utilization protein B [Bacteroidia bacterium]|jgi:L-lactate dehydrogenase complex protein LldF|nr:lactate utilization protein B [Bacteroidia bacterium]